MSDGWLGQFKPTTSSYDHYVDFDKAVANAQRWNPELHLMNSLIGSKSIEADFGGGSKLNETSRSYKEMAQESERIPGFQFVWVTDGGGWRSARNNLRETFEIMETIFNLDELENGAFKQLFA